MAYQKLLRLLRDTLWIGTTEGLYFLNEVKDYETLQEKMIQKIRINQPNRTGLDKNEEDK